MHLLFFHPLLLLLRWFVLYVQKISNLRKQKTPKCEVYTMDRIFPSIAPIFQAKVSFNICWKCVCGFGLNHIEQASALYWNIGILQRNYKNFEDKQAGCYLAFFPCPKENCRFINIFWASGLHRDVNQLTQTSMEVDYIWRVISCPWFTMYGSYLKADLDETHIKMKCTCCTNPYPLHKRLLSLDLTNEAKITIEKLSVYKCAACHSICLREQ